MSNTSSSIVTSNDLIINKTRIRDSDGFVATIRYVGTVASAKNSNEIYAGVEWDDVTRGKHDGSVICRQSKNLVRHFSIHSGHATAGSFLRLNKVDIGVELDRKLIQSRYVDNDAPLVAPNNVLPYTARTSSGREKTIEFLGEMKIRKRQQMEDLDEISLRGMGISKISNLEGCREDMKTTFEHVKEIDLAGNLFCDWDSLFEIMRIFQSVERVSFASNQIHDLSPLTNSDAWVWSRLKVLNVNKISMTSFQTVLQLEKLCPNLEQLCLAHNDLSDMDKLDDTTRTSTDNNVQVTPMTGFMSLKLLDCSSCKINSWETQVRKFSQLPNLEILILDDNPIPFISMAKDSSQSEFKTLNNLQIAGSTITQWSGIDCIANFSSLTTLRFRKCPLTDAIGTGEARAGTIARIPQITHLNASQITEKERIESERRYVSVVSREMLKDFNESDSNAASSERELIFKKYTRFEELMSKHKDTMIASQSLSGANDGKISNNAINVTIRSMAAESCTCAPMQKRLPSSMKVQRLKLMCSRAFGLNIELQLLHFRSEGDAFPTELDDDENTIGYYGVSDGAEILMNEIDLEAIQREEKNRSDMHERRIDEQEKATNAMQALQKSNHLKIS